MLRRGASCPLNRGGRDDRGSLAMYGRVARVARADGPARARCRGQCTRPCHNAAQRRRCPQGCMHACTQSSRTEQHTTPGARGAAWAPCGGCQTRLHAGQRELPHACTPCTPCAKQDAGRQAVQQDAAGGGDAVVAGPRMQHGTGRQAGMQHAGGRHVGRRGQAGRGRERRAWGSHAGGRRMHAGRMHAGMACGHASTHAWRVGGWFWGSDRGTRPIATRNGGRPCVRQTAQHPFIMCKTIRPGGRIGRMAGRARGRFCGARE